jgi:uncharacterized damage-inducible protein DinB
MDASFKSILWAQFGATIDMLENAMRACPDLLWAGSRFWHISYHALFYLDLCLSDPAEAFAPPAPFTLSELDPSGVFPDRAYTKQELQAYLERNREKCRATIETLTEEKACEPRRFVSMELSFAELLLYNMRHLQHHVGQLNFMLGQETGSAPRWVKRDRSL